MTVQFAQARNALAGLIALADVVGPQDLAILVQEQLKKLGAMRTNVFEIEAPRPLPAPDKPIKIVPPTQVPVRRKMEPATGYNPERYVPYRVLWAKVIIRAAYDYALWRESKDLRLRKFAQDAERWLFEPSALELSFESICFAFDFPVERIRARTRALTKQDVKKLEFRERHGRAEILGEPVNGNHG